MDYDPERPGYTLLEVLLVMAILVILTSVSLPSLVSMYGDTKVRGAGDEVRYAWAEARTRSIDHGVPYRFSVQFDSGTYRIAPDSQEFWNDASDSEMDDGKTLVGSLPTGINFEPDKNQNTPMQTGNWSSIAVFLPDGTCKNDATIVVKPDDGTYPLIISVRGLTGMVSVRTRKQIEEGR